MKIETININELKTPENNVRVHTEKQIKEFVKSLEAFGQTRPAVIDENNVILVGNGMVEAMKRKGDTTVEVFRRIGLSEAEKKKLMLADNKIYDLGVDNYDAIEQIISELGNDLIIPGFDEDVLRSISSTAEEVTETINNYGIIEPEEVEKIKQKGITEEAQQVQSYKGASSNQEVEERNSIAENTESEEETTEIKKFVICPKCGEKVWL